MICFRLHYSLLFLFVFFLAPLNIHAQETKESDLPENFPKTLEEFKYAIIHMPLPQETTEGEKMKLLAEKNIKRMIEGLKKDYGSFDPNMYKPEINLKENPRTTEIINSLSSLDFKSGLSTLQGKINEYKKFADEISQTEWEKFSQQGSAEEYKQNLKNKLLELEKEIERYNSQDQVAIITNYLTLDEINEADLAMIQQMDPNILSLSKEVQGILVNYHRSPDMKTFMGQLEIQEQPTGKEELIELTQILSLIESKESECWTNGSLIQTGPSSEVINNLKGYTPEVYEKKDVGQYLLGVESIKDLSKIDGYRFQDKENTYYLYQGKRTQLSDEVWVMAKIDPEGRMNFRYYRFSDLPTNKGRISTQEDIKLLQTKIQNKSFQSGDKNRIYFEAQEGIVVKGDKTKVPIIGQMTIPSDKLIIGQVNMAYITPKTFTQNSMSISSEAISLDSQTHPLSHHLWSASAGIRFSPMNQRWSVNGSVHIMDLAVGYADDLSGNRSGSLSYVIRQNFVGVASNFNNQSSMIIGSTLKNNRGRFSASTNFNQIHEVKLVLFLDRAKPKPPTIK